MPRVANGCWLWYSLVFVLMRESRMPATATLPALLALFKIDRELHTHQVALDNLLKDQKNQETKIAQLTRDLETKETAFNKLQADSNTREMEIKTRQDHIEKMRGTLN